LKVATNFTSSFKLSKKREEIKLQKAQTDAPVEAHIAPKLAGTSSQVQLATSSQKPLPPPIKHGRTYLSFLD